MQANNPSINQSIVKINQTKQVLASDVMLLKADINYTIFNLISGEKIITSYTLKSFERTFPENQFLRINKSIMLNKAFVKSIRHNEVTLLNEQVMIVSRRRIQHVLDNFKF
jgi:DNA-binding LytR/AlgR family response regulator